jgi:hypothetical protein
MKLRQTFSGMSNASAAVVLDEHHFLLFDDEKRNLHVYRTAGSGASVGGNGPVAEIKVNARLQNASRAEFDFEGAARVGEAIVGITSHAQQKSDDGSYAPAPHRRRLFALTVERHDGAYRRRKFLGYRHDLIEAFTAEFGCKPYDLEEAASHPPETDKGLNIEGMAAWAENGVIIGFRGPLFDTRALLVPLLNPLPYLGGEAARFAPPVTLDLDGHGIRDIARIDGRYLIIGGPVGSGGDFALYEWDGATKDPVARRIATLEAEGAHPEVVLSMDGGKTISVLSDDSDFIEDRRKARGKGKKKIPQQFRMFDIELD